MKRAWISAVWLAAAGCLNFDARLAECDAGGVWRCGTSTGGGSTGGGAALGGGSGTGGGGAMTGGGGGALGGGSGTGGGGAMTGGGGAGLLCLEGWCFEYPRSSRVPVAHLAGDSERDFWVLWNRLGHGLVAHHVPGGWAETADFDGAVAGICRHEGQWFVAGAAPPGVREATGGWPSAGFTVSHPVLAMACGPDRLHLLVEGGTADRLQSYAWADHQQTSDVEMAVGATCDQLLDVDGEGWAFCADASPATTAWVQRPGAVRELNLTLNPDDNVRRGTLWRDPLLGPLAATRQAQPQIYARGADGGWAPVWQGGVGSDLYAGAAFDHGSLVVGQGGVAVELRDGGVTVDMSIPSAGSPHYATTLTAFPDGGALAGLSEGCLAQRAGRRWSLWESCTTHIELIAPGTPTWATGRDPLSGDYKLLGHEGAGWAEQVLPWQALGVGHDLDGGAVLLRSDQVHRGASDIFRGRFTGAAEWAYRDLAHFVVRTGSGTLYTALPDGGMEQPAGLPPIDRVTIDRASGTFWARQENTLWSSDDGLAWAERGQFDAGIIDFAVFDGEAWVLVPGVLSHRAATDPAWGEIQVDSSRDDGAALLPREKGVVDVYPPYLAPQRYHASDGATEDLPPHHFFDVVREATFDQSGNWIITDDWSLVWQPRSSGP